MVTIDFAKALQDAKGASFEALPIGDYDVEVAKAEAVTSQNGKPMIKTTMRVVSGPYEKRPIINQFVLSVENAQAVAIFFRHMKAFGLTEEWFASLGQQGSLGPVADALLGRRARLTIGHREWQGEMRNEVKAVKPYTGAPAMAPSGPTAPGAGPTLTGPAALPPRPAATPGPTAPVAPVASPTPPPAAPPLPVAPLTPPVAPQVQSVPQPPAPAPVAEAPVAEAPVAASVEPSGQPTPPRLPY